MGIFNISIHAPRMGSDQDANHVLAIRNISIHAPRMGSDQDANHVLAIRNISIHAPRMGSDSSPDPVDLPHSHFYPRPPHGERQLSDEIAQAILKFLSTPPAWGATKSLRQTGTAYGISIHAPRMGSDTG